MKVLNAGDMRQGIATKYLGPTNFRGSRVKATAQAGSVTLNWDDSLNSDENHTAAAIALAKKFGWDERNDIVGGGSPDGCGSVFVLVERDKESAQ